MLCVSPTHTVLLVVLPMSSCLAPILQGDLAAIAKTLEFLEGVDLTPELSMVQQCCSLSHAGYSYWLRRKFVS